MVEEMAIRVGLVAALAGTAGFAWCVSDDARIGVRLTDRLLYGLPLGTALTVALILAFYLFVQRGVAHWGEPLMLPFVSWSYFYPTGVLTSGVAHGSADHLLSNLTATVVVGAIAEYAWGHYPGGSKGVERSGGASGRRGEPDSVGPRPLIRALVVFPGALFAVALFTGVFSLGPGLGFSGAVFAIVGFAVVRYPIATVIATVATSALGVLIDALSQPVVRATVETGAPAPPEWAGIGFHAHGLGFLLGAIAGIALLRYRKRHPEAGRVVLGVFLVAVVQSLWLLTGTAGDDVYVLHQGVGLILVCLLTIVLTVAVAGHQEPVLSGVVERAPSWLGDATRFASIAWLGLLGLTLFLLGSFAVLVAVVAAATGWASVGTAAVFASVAIVATGLTIVLLALPAIPTALPDRLVSNTPSPRRTAFGCLVVVTIALTLPTLALGLVTVEGETVPGDDGVDVGEYTVTYESNATSGQSFPGLPELDDEGEVEETGPTQSGLIVVSDEREIWTVGVPDDDLEHDGDGAVLVGGLTWAEEIHADRTGWEVLGNDSAYAVDLTHDGDTTRSYASEAVKAEATLDDYSLEIVPETDEFAVALTEDGERIDETAMPETNETATVGDVELSTEEADDGDRLVAAFEGTSLAIAEEETYD